MWDTAAAGDYSVLSSEESNSVGVEESEENEEIENYRERSTPEQFQSESSINKSFRFLEEHSFIDFVDSVGDYVITAGRDHDIKVWNAARETTICRLIGHNGPITGLTFQTLSWKEPGPTERTVISASEDGSIREWSIKKGIEIHKIETENVITCMGVVTDKVAAIGNHKGHLEIYSIPTGKLYAKVVAHSDPIDALVVNEMLICTAVYDRPGSLRVWQMRYGKLICIYNLEETFSIEFCTFTKHGDLLFLGDATKQTLHILGYTTDDKDHLTLCEKVGHVQHITVMEGLILASTIDNDKMVNLRGKITMLHIYYYKMQN
ncbi:WD_REPEATS_REGION domain-containing protein [Nephila pilipes]|uniref:WD_REPEATS_REGION domain-containing protein n=1 Tax=Nephila pilipes TaxID=299642 RepID=A0A8X6N0C1_NEPPI|nr:WD_REPEATS_REGION domain-containing protein [Nephila pilipes]